MPLFSVLFIKSQDRHGNVLYLGSLSKSLNPGLRIGWIAGPEAVIDRLADLKMQTDYGSSSLSQRAAAEWLSSGLYEQHLANVRKQLHFRLSFANAPVEDITKGIAILESLIEDC